jgi:hypothetical protein
VAKAKGKGRNLENGPVCDLDVARFAPQARAAAIRADALVDELGELLLHYDRIGLAVAALEVRYHALEGMRLHRAAAFLARIVEGDRFLARAVQHQVLHFFVEHLPGRLDVELVVARERLQHRVVEMVAPVPAPDRAGGERQVRVRDDALRVEEVDAAQAVAARAGAHRVVEGKEARLELGDGVVAQRAGELRREQVFLLAVLLEHQCPAVGVAQRGLQRLGEALLGVGARLDAVDDDVDGVLGVLRQLRRGVELVHAAVDAHPREALRAQLFQKAGLLAFARRDHRREDHELRFRRQREQLLHHLRHRLRLQRDRVLGAVRRAGAREQQAQVIVDLGDRAHRRARVVARRLLLDGDRRRKPLDEVDVGLLHELQELARVRGKALDVAPLAFGVERVEGERTLARAGKPGDHHQAVAGELEAEVLEVMRPRAADANGIQECRRKR